MRATTQYVPGPSRSMTRTFECLIPWVLFMAFIGAFAALAAAVHTQSLLFTIGAVAALIITVTALAGWVLTADRRATALPKHVSWYEDQWADFEREFWSYVDDV
jgi:hypothetical protein